MTQDPAINDWLSRTVRDVVADSEHPSLAAAVADGEQHVREGSTGGVGRDLARLFAAGWTRPRLDAFIRRAQESATSPRVYRVAPDGILEPSKILGRLGYLAHLSP